MRTVAVSRSCCRSARAATGFLNRKSRAQLFLHPREIFCPVDLYGLNDLEQRLSMSRRIEYQYPQTLIWFNNEQISPGMMNDFFRGVSNQFSRHSLSPHGANHDTLGL